MTKQVKGFNKTPEQAVQLGGRFEMDFGFVRGETMYKNEDGTLLASKGGFNCYLIIADEFSRHLCILLFTRKSHWSKPSTHFLRHMGSNQVSDESEQIRGENWLKLLRFVS